MIKHYYLLISFCFALLLANAQTNVTGGINSNTTWAKINSPLVVTDITGRTVATVLLSTASRELSTDNLANGIYLVTVTGAGGRVGTKKLVISK